jgi:hypothetical protein
MAGENAYIWQCQNGTSGQRTAVQDLSSGQYIISFNNTGKIPSGGSGQGTGTPPLWGAYITDINTDYRRAVPENEAVDADNNEIQDMGIGGFDVIIKGVIGDANNDTTQNPVNKFKQWLKDGNTTTTFTKGRYGLEFDNAPHWDVEPNTDKGGTGGNYGYHIRYVRFNYIGEKYDMAEFEIALALGGDIANAF